MKIRKLNEASTTLSFKGLVEELNKINSVDSANEVMGKIDNSFQAEKISWKDHETLYDIASKLYELYK